MGDIERRLWQLQEQPPDGHFYAAYIFDNAETRQADVTAVVTHALQLGYPIRYW